MADYLGRTALVLPGSAWQVPLVRRLRAEGCRVLSVNPYPDSPAFVCSDGHLQADIFSEDEVYDYCAREGVSAVLSDECDIAVPVVARLAARLGIPGPSEEAACLFTDKSAMRAFCEGKGFPSPEYRRCATAAEARAFATEVGLPVVVKPLDSNSSRGVSVVGAIDEIGTAFCHAAAYSRAVSGALVERFVDGVEFTVDGVKTPEGHRTLAISRKKHFSHNESVASELLFAESDPEFDYQALRELNDGLIDATPLEFGLTHVEYKFEAGRYYLIEMAARGGGNLISSHIVPFVSGVDNYGYLIGRCLGGSRPLEGGGASSGRCALLKFIQRPPSSCRRCRVRAVEGVDVLRDSPEIAEWRLNFSVGDEIGDAENDAARLGFYIALCDSMGELAAVRERIDRELRIVV